MKETFRKGINGGFYLHFVLGILLVLTSVIFEIKLFYFHYSLFLVCFYYLAVSNLKLIEVDQEAINIFYGFLNRKKLIINFKDVNQVSFTNYEYTLKSANVRFGIPVHESKLIEPCLKFFIKDQVKWDLNPKALPDYLRTNNDDHSISFLGSSSSCKKVADHIEEFYAVSWELEGNKNKSWFSLAPAGVIIYLILLGILLMLN